MAKKIQRLSKNKFTFIESYIKAENMLKWVLTTRAKFVQNLRLKLNEIRKKVDTVLIKSNTCLNIKDKYEILMGESLHTSSTEPYFFEPTYMHNINQSLVIIVDENGISHLNPEIKNNKKWLCNPMFCNVNDYNKLWRRINFIYCKIISTYMYLCLKYTIYLTNLINYKLIMY